jgi:hypothetical protein
MQVLLKDYSQLLEDYKTLKKSQEANGVKNGDNGFTDSARNPYVLVLIDGNGYIVMLTLHMPRSSTNVS